MPFYQKGDVRIRYEEIGSGFPLLVTPGRRIEFARQQLADRRHQCDGRVQERLPLHHHGPAQCQWRRVHRPGAGRERVGRLRRRPARADGPSRDPRILLTWATASAAASPASCCSGRRNASSPPCSARPSATGPKTRTSWFGTATQNWLPDFRARRPEVSMETIEKYFHSLWRVQPDFLYSVSRDFISELPDADPGPAGRHVVASAADLDRRRVAGAQRRDHGLPVARAAGAQGPHDRPRAHVPQIATFRCAAPRSNAHPGRVPRPCPSSIRKAASRVRRQPPRHRPRQAAHA